MPRFMQQSGKCPRSAPRSPGSNDDLSDSVDRYFPDPERPIEFEFMRFVVSEDISATQYGDKIVGFPVPRRQPEIPTRGAAPSLGAVFAPYAVNVTPLKRACILGHGPDRFRSRPTPRWNIVNELRPRSGSGRRLENDAAGRRFLLGGCGGLRARPRLRRLAPLGGNGGDTAGQGHQHDHGVSPNFH